MIARDLVAVEDHRGVRHAQMRQVRRLVETKRPFITRPRLFETKTFVPCVAGQLFVYRALTIGKQVLERGDFVDFGAQGLSLLLCPNGFHQPLFGIHHRVQLEQRVSGEEIRGLQLRIAQKGVQLVEHPLDIDEVEMANIVQLCGVGVQKMPVVEKAFKPEHLRDLVHFIRKQKRFPELDASDRRVRHMHRMTEIFKTPSVLLAVKAHKTAENHRLLVKFLLIVFFFHKGIIAKPFPVAHSIFQYFAGFPTSGNQKCVFCPFSLYEKCVKRRCLYSKEKRSHPSK